MFATYPLPLSNFTKCPPLAPTTLTCFSLGEFIRANREKKQLDCLATNTDDITTQSHSLFACSGDKNRKVETGFSLHSDLEGVSKKANPTLTCHCASIILQ